MDKMDEPATIGVRFRCIINKASLLLFAMLPARVRRPTVTCSDRRADMSHDTARRFAFVNIKNRAFGV